MLLLKDCALIITQNKNRDILKEGDILIENGKIKKIGKDIKVSSQDCEIVNCKDRIVLPSFINAHTHLSMTLLRGYKDDLELHSWLNEVWKIEAKMKEKDFYVGAKFGCLELIKSGTSCFLDMYFGMEHVFKATEEAKIRGFLGYGMIDFEDEEKREKEIKETLKFVEFCLKKENPLIKPVVSPHAIYTCSKKLLINAKEIAKEKNLLYTIHLSETRKEVYDCYKKYKKRPVEYLEELKILDENFVGFHASWLTKREISILSKYNAKVVHCPISNMKLATGGAFPFREYKENKVLVGLGTDGACSNNSLNMLNEMKVACLLQKWFRWNACEMIAKKALDLATLNNAKILGLNAGSIEEGKVADILLLDKNHLSLLPSQNIISNIVYSCSREAISDLIVNGKFVMKNRTVLTLDEEKVKDEFKNTVSKLIYAC